MDFPGHFKQIFNQLNHQRLHAQLCDCVVVVGGQSFQAHRSILAACSSHFRALLSSSDSDDKVGGPGSDTGGGGGPSVMELDPEVVTPEAFSTLLDMIYTSTLSLRASNVMDVLLAASHLHLNAVVKACKLHLSRKNFPASPPKGWRSVQQQQCSQEEGSVTSVTEEDTGEEGVGVEVSQSGGVEDHGVRRKVSGEQSPALFPGQKRKSQEDTLSGRKRSCRLPEGNYKECSPTVTRSTISTEEGGEELLSSDCLKTTNGLWQSRGKVEEEEEKYEATKGDLEEIQLPSQSDSGTAGVGAWEKGRDADGGNVVKVKVGEEGEDDGEEMKMPMIEREAGDLGEESVDGEGLDSLSELAFSCFLNPSSESVMGALEEEDSLASLTAAATAAAATASDTPAAAGDEPCQNSEAQSTDSSSSLMFPVTSVPLQQLLPTQGPSFSDTLILQPTQNTLAGFLSGIRPSLGLENSLVQPSRAGKSSGATTFRRIAPKVPPGSEAGTDLSSASAGDAADRPPLTRASEDVMSKCKKAAAEDHVLLVEGEKKYACKICCKTFMNLTDCKKHIRVHTGEKPYPCPKCGKRFSQSSHLYKHSKNTCLNWKDDSFPESLL
ncbi:Zinc finger and BTB domain-containing protein 5 [Larimichthys crocea]|uniref:Zinc finger and BTB domain-containing protein 5 n=1 Tax=Larimichthys crocea TaxID=215358 RepID=A0A6G0I3X9_LARCR|nr:Zinc finger and BTB domain-containing protein 5 [Larimichthys crocea]